MTTAQTLIDATIAVAAQGVPLMLRVLPGTAPAEIWAHYPTDDAVDPASGSRWFYHAHPPGERDAGEHGHFHLFFAREIFDRAGASAISGPPSGASSGADVVHLFAIAIDITGLPTRLFTVNRWVTDEWLYPAAAIIPQIGRFDLSGASGDALVNAWLTAAVAFFAPQATAVLEARDAAIAAWPEASFEDRGREILSTIAIDVNDAVQAA
jgi:hypothetical protein